MPWRFSEDLVSTFSSSTDQTEDVDRPKVTGGLARCKGGDFKKTAVTPTSGSRSDVQKTSPEELKRSTAAPIPDHNQNMILLRSLSGPFGNLLSADRIMREVFKTEVQLTGLSSTQNQEPHYDDQPVEHSQNEEIAQIKTPHIRPAKRKSFPKPIPIIMSKSSRPHQTKHKSPRPFPPPRSPPSPQPTPPTSSYMQCFSCPRKCAVSAEGELACCKVCRKAQTKLFQAAARISRGKLGRNQRDDLDEILQPVQPASDDGQLTHEHCEDSKLERISSYLSLEEASVAAKIFQAGGLSPSSTLYPSQCDVVSSIPPAHNTCHPEANSPPTILPLPDQASSSSHESEEAPGYKMEMGGNYEIANKVKSGKSVKEQSAVSQISQKFIPTVKCSEPEATILDPCVKSKDFGKIDVDSRTSRHGIVPDLLNNDTYTNLATHHEVEGDCSSHPGPTLESHSLLSQLSNPYQRSTRGMSNPEGRVCKVKCKYVNNSVFKLQDIEKIKQLENITVDKVSKSAQDFTVGKSSSLNILDPTHDNPSMVVRNHSPGSSDQTNQSDNVLSFLMSPSSKYASSPLSPLSASSAPLQTRPKRISSSKRECPSCGKLSLLPGQAVCCGSCVAAQEQLLRQKRRKTFHR